MKLVVSNRVHNAVWVGVLLLHTSCVVFLLTSAHVLWFLADPAVAYLVSYVKNGVTDHFSTYAMVIGVVGALHGVALLRLLILSARTRSLTLNTFAAQRLPKPTVGQAQLIKIELGCRTCPVTLFRRAKHALGTGFNSVFGLGSPYFEEVLMVREGIEIAAQAYQAYRCSTLIARHSINNSLIAVVILNCWSTPLIRSFVQPRLPRKQLLVRLLCVVVNLGLNVLTSICLPVTLVMPYYLAFDTVWLTFSLEHFYDPVWFTAFITESQLIFPVSVVDFLYKLVPHVSVLVSLLLISFRVVRQEQVSHQCVPVLSSGPASRLIEGRVQPQRIHGSPTRGIAHIRRSLSRLVLIGNVTMVLAGYAFFALHIHAKISVDSREQVGCLHKVYPWLPSKFPCAAFMYNCFRHGVVTVQTDHLADLDSDALLWLMFCHCEALVVPAQQFGALIGFAVYNSTLINWGVEAAFSAATQPNLRVLLFVQVNFTTFPSALSQPLPPTLSDIEFSHTNLTILPSNLHEYWAGVEILYLEHCAMTEFPETITRLPNLYDFSLLGNNISDMRLFANMSSTLTYASLDLNPAQHLPDQLNAPHAIMVLALENMKLQTIPGWVRTDVTAIALVFGNPYCEGNPVDDVVVKCIMRDERGQGKLPSEYVSETAKLIE